MREILFRGINEGHVWSYGELTNASSIPQIHIEPDGIIGPFSITVRPETVGQYTGIKASVTKFVSNIFEDDKVILHMSEFGCDVPTKFKGVVKFIDGQWVVDSGENSFPLFQELGWWEITGNIHES